MADQRTGEHEVDPPKRDHRNEESGPNISVPDCDPGAAPVPEYNEGFLLAIVLAPIASIVVTIVTAPFKWLFQKLRPNSTGSKDKRE